MVINTLLTPNNFVVTEPLMMHSSLRHGNGIMVSEQKIVLINPDTERISGMFCRFSGERKLFWLYLGRDVRFSIELEQLIGSRGVHIPIAVSLQRKARECRQRYLDDIGDMGSQNPSLCWYLTSISEKNPFISNLYLYACYMLVARDCIASHDGDFLIICESDALCLDMEKMLEDMPVSLEIFNKHSVLQSLHKSAIIFRTAKHKFYFILKYSARCLFARIFAIRSVNKRTISISKENESTGLLSWVDNRSFSSDGKYTDVYFGMFRHLLKKECSNVYQIVDVLPTAPYRTVLRNLNSQNEPFFIMEEFITPIDILRALFRVNRWRPHLKTFSSSMGLSLENIISAEFDYDRQGFRAEQSLLYYYAAIRISQKRKFGTFFYPFENHTWEKMFLAGFRSQTCRARLIGYAHTIVNPLYTCYAISSKERGTIPLPDIIMVNGERAKKGLESSGFPAGSTIISGALRYPHLQRGSQKQLPHTKTVLVVASAGINHTLEIVYKAFYAFSDHPELNIIIKCHPTTPYDLVRNQLPEFPRHILISDKKIDELLLLADVVVYSESAACLEALAQGIPVVHVLSDYSFDMNVLEGVDFVRSVGTSDELYGAVASELVNGPVVQEKAIHVVNEIFAPVDEGSILSVFKEVTEEKNRNALKNPGNS